MDATEIWEKALFHIKASVNSDIAYSVYIKRIVAVSYTDSVFTVLVPLELHHNMIRLRYKNNIETALEQVTGKKYNLDIKIEGEPLPEITKEEATIKDEERDSSNLNPKYTFENFVIGSSNQYAAASAISTTENPGHIYNPLFLYGNSGLGKTHLMHAIGNRIRETHPDYKIIYVTSEQFMNEFVDSLVSNSPMKFKRKYRNADVLLIDDVQFLENKEGLQEEVFHTFNDLYARNKQIVLTSDRMPNELVKLETRLRTRFGQGLTFDISIPDFETRVAILKRKAKEHNFNISDDVLIFVAEKIKTNVRELEGALIKMISMAEISHDTISMSLAKDIITSLLPDGIKVKITPDKIMEKVALYYNITKQEIMGKSRTQKFTLPRQVAMYLCYTLTDMNYSMIGNAFGGKDRTTAMHNIKKIEDEIKINDALNKEVNYILKDIQSH